VSEITNCGLTRSGAGCWLYPYDNSGCQTVKNSVDDDDERQNRAEVEYTCMGTYSASGMAFIKSLCLTMLVGVGGRGLIDGSRPS